MRNLLVLVMFAIFGYSSPICEFGTWNPSSGVCESSLSCEGIEINGECVSSPLSEEVEVYSLLEEINNECNIPAKIVVNKTPGRVSFLEKDAKHIVVDKNVTIEEGEMSFETTPASWSCPSSYVLGGVSDNVNNCEYKVDSSLCPSGQTWNSTKEICEGYSAGNAVPGNVVVIDYANKTGSRTTTTGIVGSGSFNINDFGSGTAYGDISAKASGKAFVRYTSYGVPKLFQSSTFQMIPKADGAFFPFNEEEVKYIAYCESSTVVNIRYDWNISFDCLGTVTVDTTACPSGYSETTGAETAKGQCKKNITYNYYKYTCPTGYDAPVNQGIITPTIKTDTNNQITNPELATALNSATPPANNCYIKSNITCKDNGVISNSGSTSMCLLESNLKCPNGGILDGINCLTNNMQCEEGFSLQNGNCSKITATCPAGFEEASETTCKQTSYVCPENTVEVDGKCKRTLEDRCPIGYTEVNNKCEKETFNPNCQKIAQCIRDEIKCDSGSYPTPDGKLCITKKSETCQMGYRYNPKTEKCESRAYCPSGFIDTKDGCIREYEYSLYSCPEGFEEPLDRGFDCGGSSPSNGYACNAQTPPANNCRKPITLDKPVEIIKKRELETHLAYGSVVAEEYGTYKGFNCGEDCQFTISKITGEDDNLCFFQKNGEKNCISVRGCSFNGTIENNTYPNDIQELNILNQYTIALEYDNPAPLIQEDGLECPNGMQYDKKVKYCVSPTQNFYTWIANNNGTGKWQVLNQTEVYQTVNGNNHTFFLSPIKYPKDVLIQGDIQVTDGGADDDIIGLVFDYKDANNYKTIVWDNGGDYAKGLLYAEFKNGARTDYNRHSIRWKTNVKYNIKILYTLDSVQVFINNSLYIDYKNNETNEQELGQAGFVNHSQANVRYSNFKIESKPVCTNDYNWDSSLRLCHKQPTKNSPQTIVSSCKMNGHVGWHSRNEGITSIIPDNPKNINRIKFWDSYQDKDLGFIEFVKDVKDEDKKDGFIPENQFLYEMLAADFTATEVLGNNTFFVSSKVLTEAQCSAIGAKKGLPKASLTSNSIKELLKKLSGDRYVKTEVEPVCPGGVYSEEAKSCVAVTTENTEKSSCPSGGFDTVNGVFQWDNSQGDNMTAYAPIYIPVNGNYKIEIRTKGKATLYINNDVVGIGNANEPIFNVGHYLTQGVHELKVVGNKDVECPTGALNCNKYIGERGFQIIIFDKLGTVISNSAEWCKNVPSQSCPDNGYAKIGNMCVPKTIPHCPNGQFDDEKYVCVIEPKCILVKNGEHRFNDQTNSEKIETRDSDVLAFKCSPLKCVNNACQTASCPIDNPPYKGSIIHSAMKSVKSTECIADICDANKEYYPYCGREQGCDKSNPLVFETEAGECMEIYCPADMILDISSRKCKKLECPSNSVKQADGSCKRK